MTSLSGELSFQKAKTIICLYPLLPLAVERHCKRVECLVQEHNALILPGLEPRPQEPEPSALGIRPWHLLSVLIKFYLTLA